MNDPVEVDIKVILHPESDPPFHLDCGNALPQGPEANFFIFKNNGHPGFVLNYILEDPTNTYFFPDDTDEALYSAKGRGCPTLKRQWGQFKADKHRSNNNVLVVRNMNGKGHEGEFGYRLRVTTRPHDDDADYLDLDPGGRNDNGPTSRSNVSLLTAAVIGVATGVASAVATAAVLEQLGLTCRAPGF
jgi:hypothetical protein